MKVSIAKRVFIDGDSFHRLEMDINDRVDLIISEGDIEIVDIIIEKIDIFLCGIIKYKIK